MVTDIITHLIAFVLGGAIVYAFSRFREHYLLRARAEKHEQMLALAQKENEIQLREMRVKVEDELRARQEEVRKSENDAANLQAQANRILDEIKNRAAQIHEMEDALKKEQVSFENEKALLHQEILRVANITAAEARKLAMDVVRQECEMDIARLRHEVLDRREDEIREESRRILVATMQRLAPTIMHEANATLVSIPVEEMKGRLIGKEGRNIKTFEQVTGCTLLIDETPGTVLVSSFDPVRREIARMALENLIKDGRIHPASIEEFVENAREEVIANATDLGRTAVKNLHLPPMAPAITELLGRLHFRLSVNQNTLEHSVETAQLAAMIASELGIDPIPAKRAGLLHDIGKAINAEQEGSHALAGARLLKQHDEDPVVVNAVAAHHREADPTSIYSPIVMLADTLSATRPGARSSTMEGYIERVRSLENIAKSFRGVAEAYAISAGREVRVIVSPEWLSEEAARDTARKIRARIEEEINYPATIKITLIREQRFQEEAR